MDNPKSKRPERRTALVAKELARYDIDIAALSETRREDMGLLEEKSIGYTFFWSGRSSEERRVSGVGFAIKSHIANKLTKQPTGLNDRLMSLTIPLTKKKNATLISAYAPTMTNDDETKDKFYLDLDTLIASVNPTDKLIILGDFNARVGTDHKTWEGTIGKHGIGKSNSNGLLLLRTCTMHDLVITNTLFRLPTRKKTSWMHPRSKHWHLIDYVITRARDISDVRVTKAMCGADCWTDHRLILSKLNLRIQHPRRPQKPKPPKRLNVSKLECKETADEFSKKISSELSKADPTENSSIEEKWASFRDTVHCTALELLGPARRSNKDWFDDNDEEIQRLLDSNHKARLAHQSDPNCSTKANIYKRTRSTVQKSIRKMKDDWLSSKADEIQGYADCHDTKRFYDSIKTLYGPQPTGTSPLLSVDGSQLVTEKDQILKRWAEHFDSVLNRESAINDAAINRLPQIDVNENLELLPTEDEVHRAVNQLSNGKAPGPDAIPAEVYKKGGPAIITRLTELFQSMWEHGVVPQQLKDANVVHIYKRKGNRQSCDNHRGISLLSIAGKTLARVLLNRLLEHLESGLLPESQCGFRAMRSTEDMIFAARQLQEKCQEQHSDLLMTFVDLTKAFDTVSREGLWKIMKKFGCPDKFTSIVRQFHEGMMAKVLDNGEESEPFPVTNGVKQGCVLAPTLFSMMFSAMLTDAFNAEEDGGIPLRYRVDGELFKLSRLRAEKKVSKAYVRDMLFADDCALAAQTHSDMQDLVDNFSRACDNFGLTISVKKTEVLFQPKPGNPYSKPSIQVNGQELKAVENFTYLGSTLAQNANIDTEINNRIAKASVSFGRLRKNVWDRRGLSLSTKMKVYNAVVVTTLLYGCGTWTIYRRHARKLNHFHMSCLRKLLHIKWQDKVPDTEVLEQTGTKSVHTMLLRTQARWAGHIVRMPNHRLPKQIFYGELWDGKRKVGGQKKRYKDSLKATLKELQIDVSTWETQAKDRPTWRQTLHDGHLTAERNRIQKAKEARIARKTAAPNNTQALPCSQCGRLCKTKAGLASHLRSHKL